MNSLFTFYCHVDNPIHFEEAVKDKKLIDAMDEEINAMRKLIHGKWLISRKEKR